MDRLTPTNSKAVDTIKAPETHTVNKLPILTPSSPLPHSPPTEGDSSKEDTTISMEEVKLLVQQLDMVSMDS